MFSTALYLTRPQDVQAHLIFAAVEIGQVVLNLQGRQIYGTLGVPDAANGRVLFEVDPQLADLVETPNLGRAVRVTYEHRDNAYAFFSEIEATRSALAWLLQIPRTVERTDRRLVSRLDVSKDSGFSVEIDEVGQKRSFLLSDISSAGLSFFYKVGDEGFAVGQRLPTLLRMPGQPPIPAELEIRNSRPAPGGLGYIAGANFIHLGPIERGRISRALAAWRRLKADQKK